MRYLMVGLLCLGILSGCKSRWSSEETRVLQGLEVGPCVEQAIRESEGIESVEWADDTGLRLNFVADCGAGTVCLVPDTASVRIEIVSEGSGLGMPRRLEKQVHALLHELCQAIAGRCGYAKRVDSFVALEYPAGRFGIDAFNEDSITKEADYGLSGMQWAAQGSDSW